MEGGGVGVGGCVEEGGACRVGGWVADIEEGVEGGGEAGDNGRGGGSRGEGNAGGDGFGDAWDAGAGDGGLEGDQDNCPLVHNPDQRNSDRGYPFDFNADDGGLTPGEAGLTEAVEAVLGVDLHVDERAHGNGVDLADLHGWHRLRRGGELESLPPTHEQ